MVGDGHGDRVGRAGSGHRACRAGRTDPFGDLGIGCRGAGRDVAQGLPDPLLKRGAPDIERQVESPRRRFDQSDDPGNQGFEPFVPADQMRAGKVILKLADEGFGVAA